MSKVSEIEERIARTERRLVAHEDAVREHVRVLSRKARRARAPLRLVGVVGGGLIAGAVFVTILRRLLHSDDEQIRRKGKPSPSASDSGGGLPWLRIGLVAASILSSTWRSSPGARNVTTLVLPIAERFWRGRRRGARLPAPTGGPLP